MKIPKYQRLAADIENIIGELKLKPGDKLPTERELAQRLNAAYVTIRQANNYLINKGLIVRRHGSGTFVAEQKLDNGHVVKGAISKKIGFLLSSSEFSGSLLRSYTTIKNLLMPLGYELFFFYTDKVTLSETLINELHNKNIHLVVACGSFKSQLIEDLRLAKITVLLSGNYKENKNFPSVFLDVYSLMEQLTQAMYDAGNKAFWLLTEPYQLYYSWQMLQGYRAGVNKAGFDLELVYPCGTNDMKSFIDHLHASQKLFGRKQALYIGRQPLVFFAYMEPYWDRWEHLTIISNEAPAVLPANVEFIKVCLPAHHVAVETGKLLINIIEEREIYSAKIVFRVFNEAGAVKIDWQTVKE